MNDAWGATTVSRERLPPVTAGCIRNGLTLAGRHKVRDGVGDRSSLSLSPTPRPLPMVYSRTALLSAATAAARPSPGVHANPRQVMALMFL